MNVYEDVREIMDRTYFYAIIHGTYRQEPGSGIELVKPLQGSQSIGSRNNRAIMNEEMVLEIRNRIYIHQEERLKVWQDYKDIISWSAFNKLICGDSWQHVDTSMIQKVHIARKGVTKAKLTITDVQNIRYQYEILKKDINDIYQQYSNLITHTSFIRVINYQTWKNVKPVSTRPEA